MSASKDIRQQCQDILTDIQALYSIELLPLPKATINKISQFISDSNTKTTRSSIIKKQKHYE